jgi:hypothetical protein
MQFKKPEKLYDAYVDDYDIIEDDDDEKELVPQM